MTKLTIGGVKLYVKDTGRGTPIVFIHPPLITHRVFTYQEAELPDHFRVIAPDLRGHGESEPSAAPLTYPLLAEDLKLMLDELGIRKAYLCGYSSGGGVALEAMLAHPDRFLGGILVSAMSEATDFMLRARIRSAALLSGWLALRPLAFGISAANADGMLMYRRLYDDALKGDIRNMEQYFRASLQYNCTERLRGLHRPVLLVYGGKDRGFARYAALMRKHLPDNTFRVVPAGTHYIPTKAGAALNGIIREWIAEQQRADEPEKQRKPQAEADERDVIWTPAFAAAEASEAPERHAEH